MDKCGYCVYNADSLNEILIHCNNHHGDDLICIQTMDKCGKKILLKYKVTPKEIDVANVVFKDNFTIEQIFTSPDAKKAKITGLPDNQQNTPRLTSILDPRMDATTSGKICLKFKCDVTVQTDISLQSSSELLSKIISLAPSVCENVSKQSEMHKKRFLQYLDLLANNKFPQHNICYMIFLDLVELLGKEEHEKMQYSSATRRFWYIGSKLFHNKFLEFFRGSLKSSDDNLTEFNFPVPSKKTVQNVSSSIPDILNPGILHEILSYYSTFENVQSVSHNLSCDLKKINPSKGSEYGWIDLFGHEEPKKANIDKLLKLENDLIVELVDLCDINLHLTDVCKLAEPQMFISKLKELIVIASKTIQDLRKFLQGKQYALERLLAQVSETDWRKSKYSYAISYFKTCVIQGTNAKENLLRLNCQLGFLCSMLQGSDHNFVMEQAVQLDKQSNYVCLQGIKNYEDVDCADIVKQSVHKTASQERRRKNTFP